MPHFFTPQLETLELPDVLEVLPRGKKSISPTVIDRGHYLVHQLVAYYPLDHLDDPLRELVSRNNLTAVGGAPDFSFPGTHFDGVSDYYQSPAIFNNDDDVTVSFWFKMPTTGGVNNDRIFELGGFGTGDGGIGLEVETANSVNVIIWEGATAWASDPFTVGNNTWHHCVVHSQVSPIDNTIWFDGQWFDEDFTRTRTTTQTQFSIGVANNTLTSEFCNCTVSDLMIWHGKIPKNYEIKRLYEDPYQFLKPAADFSRVFIEKPGYLLSNVEQETHDVPMALEGDPTGTTEAHLLYQMPKILDGDYSVSFWIYLNSDNNDTPSREILRIWDETDTNAAISMYFWQNDVLAITFEEHRVTDPREIAHADNDMVTGQWHHVVFVSRNPAALSYTNMDSYLDGKVTDTYGFTLNGVGNPIYPGGDIYLMGSPGNSDRSADIALTGLGIFDRALTQDEIMGLAGGTDNDRIGFTGPATNPRDLPGCIFAPDLGKNENYCPITRQFPVVTSPSSFTPITTDVRYAKEPQKHTFVDVADLPVFGPAGEANKATIAIPNDRLIKPELMIPDKKPIEDIEIDWSNAITRDLDFFMPCQAHQIALGLDLVSKNFSSVEWVGDGTPKLIVSDKGLAADLSQDTWFEVKNNSQFSGVTHMSFAGWFNQNTIDTIGAFFNILEVSPVDYWGINTWSTGGLFFSNWVGAGPVKNTVVSDYSQYITAGEWFHIAFVFDGTLANDDIAKFYINGELVPATADAGQYTTTANETAEPIRIGYHAAQDAAFIGQMLCAMGWTRSLEAHEVKSLYHNTWQMVKPTQPQMLLRRPLETVPMEVPVFENNNFAKSFDKANPDYLTSTVSNAPTTLLTFSCWFKAKDTSGDKALISLGELGTGTQLIRLYVGGTGDAFVYVRSRGGGSGNATIATTESYTADKWHHAVCLIESSASRYAYLDGRPSAQDTLVRSPVNIDTLGIGCLAWNEIALGDHMDGQIFEPTVWDVALTDTEIKALAAGADPLSIRRNDIYSFSDNNNFDVVREKTFDITGNPKGGDIPPLRSGPNKEIQVVVEEDKIPGFVLPEPRFEAPRLLIPDNKPTIPVVIDWSDPLTDKLDFYLLMQADNIQQADLVTTGDEYATFEYIGGPGSEKVFGSTRGIAYDLSDASFDSPNRPQFANATEFSVAGWFLQNTIDTKGPMFGQRGNTDATEYWSVDTWTDGLLYWSNRLANDYTEAYVDYSPFVTAGEWFHIAFVWNGALANDDRPKLYINGQLISWDVVDIDQHAVSGNNTDDLFYIGYYEQGTPAFFDGLASVAMGWTRALSDAEISQIYENSFRFLIPE